MTDYTANVLDILATASDDSWNAGKEWYSEAHNLAREISPNNVMLGAGIIAVHSIQTSWNINVRYARETMITGVSPHGLSMVRGKAERMLAGEDILSVLHAPKTSAFAATIADSSVDMVVVDRHARDIAFGAPIPKNPAINKGLYREISDSYRAVAAAFNLYPSQVQAITWVEWRNRKGLSWAD